MTCCGWLPLADYARGELFGPGRLIYKPNPDGMSKGERVQAE